jgi:hypothetical protein
MNLRRLKEQGILQFTDFLYSLIGNTPLPYPSALLTDPEVTDEISPSIEIEQRAFGTRFAAAEYLFNLFKGSGLIDIERDRDLWAWLSLFYFEELCPPDAKGRRKPGELARWILNTSGRRYYRHLLAGPFFVFRQHAVRPERALALLCGPLHQMSDVYLEIADSPQLVTNAGVVELATRLYYDPQKGKLKRGTARDRPGGARRMGEVLSQFDCTWDLYSMDADEVLSLLPREFDRFKEGWQSTLFSPSRPAAK